MTDAPLKVVRLEAENVKRLVAVEVEPDGSLVLVGGKNGAGKSSLLDSIAYALGGQALVCERPLRDGAERGHVEVDLDAAGAPDARDPAQQLDGGPAERRPGEPVNRCRASWHRRRPCESPLSFACCTGPPRLRIIPGCGQAQSL